MAKKKSRVPTPPRQVAAPRPSIRSPQKGRPPSVPGGPSRTRLLLLAVGGIAAVAAVAIALVFAFGGGSVDASAALAAAGCTEQTYPTQGRQHTTQLKKGFSYNSFPPTSGPHHPQWALWGFYENPIPFIRAVHNLEHGGIVINYGKDVPEATINQIRSWWESDPNGLLVSPLPGNALPDKVTLTAWTHLATCPGFNEQAFDDFRDAYRFKGPERLPAEALQPGT